MKVFTVSTVLDTVDHVRDFVERNLRAGVDHMVVFLDADLPDVRAMLAAEQRVSIVTTDEQYWVGHRPERLNARQRINANLARTALLAIEPDAWLFHIDGDECLDISRERLDQVAPTTDVVALEVREALSSSSQTAEGWYKRLLTTEECALLHTLGVLDRPTNRSFFHGHVVGKAGMRLRWELSFRTHDVVDKDGTAVEGWRDPQLCLLHHDAVTIDELAAKAARFQATTAAFRPSRRRLWQSVSALTDNPVLSEERKAELLREIYRRHVEEPVELLRELGYVVAPDPAQHSGLGTGLSPDQRDDLDELLRCLRRGRKDVFRPRRSQADQADRLRQASRQLPPSRRSLARRIDAACRQASAR